MDYDRFGWVARTLGGQRGTDEAGRPCITFVHRGAAARLTEGARTSDSGGSVTFDECRVAMDRWNRGGLLLELAPATFWTLLGRLLGHQRTVTGDGRFDGLFAVTTNDDAAARQLLDERFRFTVEQLYNLNAVYDVVVTLDPLHLVVRKSGWQPNAELLQRFVAYVLGLVDAVVVHNEAVPEIQSVGEAGVDGEAPRCEVCGLSVEGRGVCCDRCRTPYHLDCWEFVGHCSTYACGCTEVAPWPPRT